MNPLTVEPTSAQARLLEVVWTAYSRFQVWPIFRYVEATLFGEPKPLDARTVLLDCPRVGVGIGPAHYGWAWVENAHLVSPQPGDRVGLTVAGMGRLRQAEGEVQLFLRGLQSLVRAGRSFRPSPSEVQLVEVTSDDVRRVLFPPRPGHGSGSDRVTRLGDLLRHEPSTWGCVQKQPGSDKWTAKPESFLVAYDGLASVDAYVDQLVAQIAPPRPQPPPPQLSSLALHEAIDYLNAVWRVTEHKDLCRIPRAAAAAKLAGDCTSSDDFDARLTALYGIFSELVVPGTKDTKPGALKPYLRRRLPPSGPPRAMVAVGDLQDFLSLRASRAHPGVDRGVPAMRRLGVELPTDDWEGAWRTLAVRMVTALNALREEVELLNSASSRPERRT